MAGSYSTRDARARDAGETRAGVCIHIYDYACALRGVDGYACMGGPSGARRGDDDDDDDADDADGAWSTEVRTVRALTRWSRALRRAMGDDEEDEDEDEDEDEMRVVCALSASCARDEGIRVQCAEDAREAMEALGATGRASGKTLGAREVAMCARACAGDACGCVVVSVMRALERGVVFLVGDDDEAWARAARDAIAVGARHRLSAARAAAVVALGAALEVGDRYALVSYFTGCDASCSLSVNHFGALIRDRSASVRATFTRVLGRCLADDDRVASRVLPYVLTALCDDIDDVRVVAEDVVSNVIGTLKFEELVGQNFGHMLEPALRELAVHAGTGWYEDIAFQTLRLIHTLIHCAHGRVIQFVPNIYESMHAVINHEQTEERAKREAKKTLDALERACPDAAAVFSQLNASN